MRDERARLVYEAARRHRRGDSTRSIARALGIARKTVQRMLDDIDKRRDEGDDALAIAERDRRRNCDLRSDGRAAARGDSPEAVEDDAPGAGVG